MDKKKNHSSQLNVFEHNSLSSQLVANHRKLRPGIIIPNSISVYIVPLVLSLLVT